MSNPTQPGATPSKGGMPKWLIILLVVFLLIALGCCGGLGTCYYVGKRAVNKAREKAGTLQQQMEAEVAARNAEIADFAARNAAAAARGAGVGGPGGAGVGGSGGAVGGGGGGAGGVAAAVLGRLPGNFPKDIPVMTGLSSTGVSFADNAKGSGMASFTGKMKREDATAYYQKQLKDQGWTLGTNMDIGEATTMVFTKDTRQATVQIVAETDQTMVNVIYETK